MTKITRTSSLPVMHLHQAAGLAPVSPFPMEMSIRFPGGLAVEADLDGHTVRTDQPVAIGGGGSAPSPFDLFLASIGTCAGYYALRFCQARALPTEDLGLRLTTEKDPASKQVTHVSIELALPPEFPENYREAIVRAVEQCSVKKHLLDPPHVEVTARPFSAPRPPVEVARSFPA